MNEWDLRSLALDCENVSTLRKQLVTSPGGNCFFILYLYMNDYGHFVYFFRQLSREWTMENVHMLFCEKKMIQWE